MTQMRFYLAVMSVMLSDVLSGLQSNTGYVARVSVLCDECTNTPTSFRTTCTGQVHFFEVGCVNESMKG